MNNSTNEEVIADLKRVCAEEIEASRRELHLLNAVRGIDRLTIQPVLNEGLQETIQHDEVIDRNIRSLGHVPRMDVKV